MHVFSNLQYLPDYFRKSSQLYYILADLQGRLISANPFFIKRCGPLNNESYNDSGASVFIPADRNKYHLAIQQCTGDLKAIVPAELHVRTIDDCLQTINWEFSIRMDEKESIQCIQGIGVIIDETKITERQAAQRHLQESELFYRNLFANSLDGVLITDIKGKITFASASIRQILGYGVEEVMGQIVFNFAHPDDHLLGYAAFMDEVAQQPRTKFISIRLLKKTGEWIWCNVRGHNLMQNPHIEGMVIYFCDDTMRKHAEDALLESEERFRSLIYNLSQGVVLLNEKEEVVIYNRAAQLILGTVKGRISGGTLFNPEWNIIHEDGQEFGGYELPVQMAIQTKKPVRDVVVGIQRPEASHRTWLLANADPALDKEGNIFNIICSFIDITEQKRLSHQLIEQEIQKQRQLTQATIDGQEKERLEIGKELHDNIGQHLTTTRLYLEVGKEKASTFAKTMADKSASAKATADMSASAEATADKSASAEATADKSAFAEATADKSAFAEASVDKSAFAEATADKSAEEALEMITLAHKNLSDIINEIRLLSQSLVPPTLGDLGMIESVQDLCDALKRAHTFNIDFYHRHFNEELLPENLKLMLFRIIQEQVNNIIRHAKAGSIQIRLQCDAENVVLIVSDNGNGFNLSDYKKGLGFTNITNRTQLFNGKVEIDAAPGEGCSLSIAIPLPFNHVLEMN